MDTRTLIRLKFVCISLCCLCWPPSRSAALPLISVPSSLSALSLLFVSLFVPPILFYSCHSSLSFFPHHFPSLLSLSPSYNHAVFIVFRPSSLLHLPSKFLFPFPFIPSHHPPFFKPKFFVLLPQIIGIVGQFCSSSSMQ